jgi:hypothetical protein
MNLVIGLILLFLLLQGIKQFARLDARQAARLVRHGGGVIGMIGALLLLLRGRIGLAAALANVVANFAGWRTTGGGATGPSAAFRDVGAGARSGRASTARSAMIEMRLDHSSGAMTGRVLSGAYAGQGVETLSRPELMALRRELARDDPDGLNLLEAYLDRRFTGWREADEGQRQARGGGAMSRREALQVLGLAEGASEADIIRAHRALMKKFHPDHGGSTTLAARVNQAKDVLMQRQG